MNRFLDVYWVIYFVGYLVAIAVMLWLHWDGLINGHNPASRLADIFTISAGSASAFAIIVEGGGRIVLLIPRTVRKLKNEGRAEGRAEGRVEGRVEGRAEERAEWEAWLKRREKAEAANEPFDEPPPSRRNGDSG